MRGSGDGLAGEERHRGVCAAGPSARSASGKGWEGRKGRTPDRAGEQHPQLEPAHTAVHSPGQSGS